MVLDRSLEERRGTLLVMGEVDSGSKRKLEYEGMVGDEGAELPFPVDMRRSRLGLCVADVARCSEFCISVEDLVDTSP